MTVSVIKFSEFTDGGDLPNDAVTVGLGDGGNTQYNNPWTFLPPGTTGDRPAITSAIYYRLRLNTSLQQYEYYDPITMSWVEIVTANLFDYTVVTSGPYQMSTNSGYIINSAVEINLFLPVTSSVGDILAIVGQGSGGWVINQTDGQSIQVAPLSTTAGVGGSLASTQQYNSLQLVCIEDNLMWTTRAGPQGTLDII